MEQIGIPMCDFKIFSPKRLSSQARFKRVVQLVKRFNLLEKLTSLKFLALLGASWEERQEMNL